MKKNELHQKIKSAYLPCDPEKIILFGSWARGKQDSYSDIDLIIILKTNKRFLDRLADLYEIWPLKKAVDILAYTPEEFETMLEENNPFLEQALKDSEVVYERSHN